MARKSRKNAGAQPESLQIQTNRSRVYSAALYARISVENEEKREADSIGTQIQLLRDFVSEREDLRIYDVYCDDSITGTSFVRAEYSRMMNDIRAGNVDCVIVKDLSRLGRNYVESGEYIEIVFPFLGVRFISINDRFDSIDRNADIREQIKNLANEMYARDISKKIRSSKLSSMKQGKYTSGNPPYGYRMDPEEKGHFLIDSETAPVVKEIFNFVEEGRSLHSISKYLNGQGIPSPGKYKYEQGKRNSDHNKNSVWYMGTIKKILTNQAYLGWMIGGKLCSAYASTGKQTTEKVPESDWVIVKGTHDPIITEAQFDRVQKILEERKNEYGLAGTVECEAREKSAFQRVLRCGECGRAMALRYKKGTEGKRQGWYYCPLHEHYGQDYCAKKAVKKEDVESAALKLIQIQIRLFADSCAAINAKNLEKANVSRFKIYHDQITRVKKKIEKYVGLKAALYADYSERVITEADYVTMGQEYAKKADELRIFLAELEKDAEKYSPDYPQTGNWKELVRQYETIDRLTPELVQAFLSSLTLFNDGHVEIEFRFRDEINEAVYLASARSGEANRYAS